MRCAILSDFTCLRHEADHDASRWMSKEPAEIFERAAEDGFIRQVGSPPITASEMVCSSLRQLKHHSSVSQYGQLNGALKLDGSAARAHFKDILYNQVCRFENIGHPYILT